MNNIALLFFYCLIALLPLFQNVQVSDTTEVPKELKIV